jgi:hypothetical protein
MPAFVTEVRTWLSIGAPASLCSTFGTADFMRVPLPAARTMASAGASVMASWSISELLASRGARTVPWDAVEEETVNFARLIMTR